MIKKKGFTRLTRELPVPLTSKDILSLERSSHPKLDQINYSKMIQNTANLIKLDHPIFPPMKTTFQLTNTLNFFIRRKITRVEQ